MRSTGEPTYFAADIAYHERQARARLRPPDQRARRRPPRLRRADEGGDGGARRRPRAARDPDPAVRPHRRGRRARVDVQAPRRVRHARRAGREIGVDATRWFMLQRSHDTTIDLDLDLAQASSPPRTPSTTSSTRTRGSRRCWPRRGRSASPRRSGATARPRRAAPSRARAGQEAARVPGRGRRGGRAPRARTGSPPTRSSSRRTFTAFYRDCRVVGRAGGRRGPPPAAVRGDAADDRPRARPARRLAPEHVVGRVRERPKVATERDDDQQTGAASIPPTPNLETGGRAPKADGDVEEGSGPTLEPGPGRSSQAWAWMFRPASARR